ncbi:MAG TPA: hypothetical protein VFT02_06400, partial [Pyrinomonadaceae bacterium]|nr:hypothetical protein [Pyrinomonadaceae bacterium]
VLGLIICSCLLSTLPGTAVRADEKLKPEDIVARHLDSIGSAEDRAAIRTRVILGVSKYVRHGPGGGATEGRVVLASENEKYMFGMKFGVPGYDVESVAFDGKMLTVGYVAPGVRSALESVFRNHESTFKHGLLTGILSSSWPLLSMNEEKAKLKYSGLKKVDGIAVHQLKYQPRKGSDLEVSLYFDAETFRHVRSEYSRIISANIGSGGVDSSANQRETRYKLVETFADFKAEGKLMLPHDYRIKLEISGNGPEIRDEWSLNLTNFVFNQPIEPGDFVVDTATKK